MNILFKRFAVVLPSAFLSMEIPIFAGEQEKTTIQQILEDSVFNNPNVTILGKPGKDTRLHYIFVPPYNYEDNQEDSEENKDVQKDTEKTVEAAKEPTA